MTELEQLGRTLIEALDDENSTRAIHRFIVTAAAGAAIAEASSVLTENSKLVTNLKVRNDTLTSAQSSKRIARALSYACLKDLSNVYKITSAYNNNLVDETFMPIKKIVTETDKKIMGRNKNLVNYLRENVQGKIKVLLTTEEPALKQQCMRQIINSMNSLYEVKNG